MIATVASGTDAPLGSVTVPRKEVVPVCGQALPMMNKQTTRITKNAFPELENFIDCSFRAPGMVEPQTDHARNVPGDSENTSAVSGGEIMNELYLNPGQP